MITIIRQSYNYVIEDSCEYQVIHELTLKIENETDYILPISVTDYRANLKVTDSQGAELVILSQLEYAARFKSIEMEAESEKILKNTWKGLVAKDKLDSLAQMHKRIAIVLPKKAGTYYEKVTLTWFEEVKEAQKKYKRFSRHVLIPILITRLARTEPDGETQKEAQLTSAVYLSIKISQRYEIIKKPTIRNMLAKRTRPEYEPIIDDRRHKVYRFDPTSKPQIILVRVKVELPELVRKWAQYGPLAAIASISIILAIALTIHEVPRFSYETLAGVIAFIVGLRVVVFHDLTLMGRWNGVHIAAVFSCAIVLFGLMLADSDQGVKRILFGSKPPIPNTYPTSNETGYADSFGIYDDILTIHESAAQDSNTTSVIP